MLENSSGIKTISSQASFKGEGSTTIENTLVRGSE